MIQRLISTTVGAPQVTMTSLTDVRGWARGTSPGTGKFRLIHFNEET